MADLFEGLEPKQAKGAKGLLTVAVVVLAVVVLLVIKQYSENMSREPIKSEIMTEREHASTKPDIPHPTGAGEPSNADIGSVDPSGNEDNQSSPSTGEGENVGEETGTENQGTSATDAKGNAAGWVVVESRSGDIWAVQCPHCGNIQEYGFTTCQKCQKTFSIPAMTCSKCSGSARIPCQTCRGNGTLSCTKSLGLDHGRNIVCPNCQGKGFVTCYECKGSKEEVCDLCKGKGSYPGID